MPRHFHLRNRNIIAIISIVMGFCILIWPGLLQVMVALYLILRGALEILSD